VKPLVKPLMKLYASHELPGCSYCRRPLPLIFVECSSYGSVEHQAAPKARRWSEPALRGKQGGGRKEGSRTMTALRGKQGGGRKEGSRMMAAALMRPNERSTCSMATASH
jgi:hypothetical protein